MSRRLLSLRIRLTLSYTAAIIVVLGVYAAAVLWFVSNSASHTLDESLREDLTMSQMVLHRSEDGTIKPYDETSLRENRRWLQVWNPTEKEPIYRSPGAKQLPVPESYRLATLADDRIHPVTTENPVSGVNPTIRVLSRRVEIDEHPVIMQVAKTEVDLREQLSRLRRLLLLGLPLGVVAAGLGGYALARRALAPVEQMAERARMITA